MTQNQFDARIAALYAQIAQLRAIKRGSLVYRTVKVKSYKVPGYTVGAHTRQIAGRP